MKLYVAYDTQGLPICVSEDVKDLAARTGISASSIIKRASYAKRKCVKNAKFFVVHVDERYNRDGDSFEYFESRACTSDTEPR